MSVSGRIGVSADLKDARAEVTRPGANGVPLFMAAGDGIALGPGDWIAIAMSAAGKTVTADTGDLLHVKNSAGSTEVKYRVILLGTSA